MHVGILRLSALGDIIVLSSFLPYIKSINADIKITWIIDENFYEILQDSPYIDHFCILPLKKLNKNPKNNIFICKEVIKRIKQIEQFDILLDFQSLIKSAIIGRLFKYKTFIGFNANGCKESIAALFYSKRINIPYESHIMLRNFALIQQAFNINDYFNYYLLRHRNLVLSELNHDNQAYINCLIRNNKLPNILFILETSSISKNYGVDNFLHILKALNIECNAYILYYSLEKEAKELSNKDKRFTLLPKLNLKQITYLLSKMDVSIGGDTGISYLSWLLKCRTIIIYKNKAIYRVHLEESTALSALKYEPEDISKYVLGILK